MLNKRTLVLAVFVFVCGWILGSNKQPVRIITSSAGGASYDGGYRTTAGDKVAAVTKRLSTGIIHIINPGDSIQSVVEMSQPGDTIQVLPGTYSETVYIDKDDIHLMGVIDQGRRATLDGRGILNDAILYSGNNIVIENFHIKDYKGNGIMGQAGNNFEIRNNLIVTHYKTCKPATIL